jgi:3-oxoacyl-[acyl-carrier protein] reductase
MSKLTGKVAIVTGASKGIGAGIAKSFGEAGASVVVNYASSREGAERVVAQIKAAGGKAIAVQADVSKPADVKRLFAETKKSYGSIDILVNNAGVFDFGPLESVTENEYRRQFDINVLGTLLATQESLGHFGPNGGSVINISSVTSANPVPNSVIYSATKSAVDSITKSLARELAPRKIRVNAIAPGGVETEGTHTVGMIGSDFEKQIVAATPLGRLGQPEDIAKLALHLASDESGWLTGERITASGGLH